MHYEGKMIQCNYLLRWQLANGKIIERFSNIVSASKYDVGETGNSTLVLSSNNYTILIGYCDEGFELEGKRVFIDMKPTKPTKVFKITRSDDVLYHSGQMGSLLSFIGDFIMHIIYIERIIYKPVCIVFCIMEIFANLDWIIICG